MRQPMITPLLLVAALLACGAADKGKTADKPQDSGRQKVDDNAKGKDAKGKDDKEKSKPDEKPACMHCGGTCGLAAVCVCEPGTKKKPKVEFDVKCEPICVAGCGSKPWPFDRCEKHAGCTTCCEEPCRCPGWVRPCKKLKKETTDEEVPTIKRRVAYVCGCCSGRCTAGCCGAAPRRQWLPSWCASLAAWWSRKPAP